MSLNVNKQFVQLDQFKLNQAKAKVEDATAKNEPAIDSSVKTPTRNTITTAAHAPRTAPAPEEPTRTDLPDSLPVVPTPTFSAKGTSSVTTSGAAPSSEVDDLSNQLNEVENKIIGNMLMVDPDSKEGQDTSDLNEEVSSLRMEIAEFQMRMNDLAQKREYINGLVQDYNSNKSEDTYNEYTGALESYNKEYAKISVIYNNLITKLSSLQKKVNKLVQNNEGIKFQNDLSLEH